MTAISKHITLKSTHKLAVNALRSDEALYRTLEKRLQLSPIPWTIEARSNRFHIHLKEAGLSVKEHNLLIETGDKASSVPFGNIHIYLDHIRSAHNVGSILRTTEALRIGPVSFSENTPYIDNKKVCDSAMGCASLVPTNHTSLIDLPRPIIALETAPDAPSIYDFSFPSICTIIVGNEEFGISEKNLALADHIVQIPLPGSKNSLNVACAFALLSGVIFNNC
ncbi:MAG: tRNA (guanosine(18)-2'-O)-methyltransferase [Chlamydiia bacterium]|nr:tRNA (guanosine(18)-2'-O)-methyltransferase [Chlamydiia bacterium]MCH9616605.1 tRNA (guanosine(18)-2'-O)-methyltransferase [Chlamydiia bacterium]MCH9629335.1 tRNA (guanosine(18)-2'-O)-methyltransferase [Chlamydiia bacterium]